MSRKSVAPRPAPPKTSQPTPAVPSELEALLVNIEDTCGRAAGVLTVAARAVAGDELTLQDDEVPTVFMLALEAAAGQLEALGARALAARAGGAA